MIDDEEAIQEMLSYFPARDVEEPVTKEFLRATLAETELRLTTNVQSAMMEQGSQIRSEMNEQGSQLRSEINDLGSQLRSEMRQMIWINAATLTAFAGVIIAAVRL